MSREYCVTEIGTDAETHLGDALEKLAAEQEGADRQLSSIMKVSQRQQERELLTYHTAMTSKQATQWMRQFSIVHMERPPTWRLIKVPVEGASGNGAEGAVMEEKVFTLQGILCGLDLPPLLDATK